MENKETKYKNTKLSVLIVILFIIFYILFPIGLIYGIIKVYTLPSDEIGVVMKLIILFIMAFLLCFIISGFIGNIIGVLKGKLFIKNEDKTIKKNNPYIYYRELPNDFGVGVTSLLFDSKIENYKDIVAVILDLCSKKYISLMKIKDKYHIKKIKDVDEQLLNNEKYILNLIISQNINNIDYEKWYDYCLKDGVDLGLYYHCEKTSEMLNGGLVKKNISKSLKQVQKYLSIGVGLIVFIIAAIAGSWLFGLLFSLIAFVLTYVVLIIPFYIIFTFISIININKMQKKTTYKMTLNNHLIRTEKGVVELQKLISFQNFLTDFGNFVDKNPEEVVIWDRYLSYAQVFGLTKEIMNSGYEQLVSNSSFQIDSIDNINIYNIEVEK